MKKNYIYDLFYVIALLYIFTEFLFSSDFPEHSSRKAIFKLMSSSASDIRAYETGNYSEIKHACGVQVVGRSFNMDVEQGRSLSKESVISALSNPYKLILLDGLINKLGLSLLRPLLFVPLDYLTIASKGEKYFELQKDLFSKYDKIYIIVSVFKNEKLWVFYNLRSSDGITSEKLLLREFRSLQGKWMLGLDPLDDAEIIDLNKFLYQNGSNKINDIICFLK